MAKFGINQRSFRYGILQKELWGRGDLPQYRDGLRDANNYLVNRQGALEPRKRLKRIASFNGPVRLIPYLTGNNEGGLLALAAVNSASDSSVQLHGVVPTVSNVIDTVYTRSVLAQIKFEQFGGDIILSHKNYVPQRITLTPLAINVVDLEGFATPITDIQYNPEVINPTVEAVYAITPVNTLGVEGPQSRLRVLHTVEEDTVNYPDITWNVVAEAASYRVYRTAIGLPGTIGLADPVGLLEEVVEPKIKVTVRNVAFAITPALITNPFAVGAVERISEISSGRGVPASQRDSIRLLRVTPNNGKQPDLADTVVPASFTNIQVIDQTVDRDATPPAHSFTITADLPSNWSIYSRWYGILRRGNEELFQLFTTDVPREASGGSHRVNVPSGFKLRFPFNGLALGSEQQYHIDIFHGYAGSSQPVVKATQAFTSLNETRAVPPALTGISITNYNNTTTSTLLNNIALGETVNVKYAISIAADGTVYVFRQTATNSKTIDVFSVNKTTGALTKQTTLTMPTSAGNATRDQFAFIHPTTNEFVVLYSDKSDNSATTQTVTAGVFNSSTGARLNSYVFILGSISNQRASVRVAAVKNTQIVLEDANSGTYYGWLYKGNIAGSIPTPVDIGRLVGYIAEANIDILMYNARNAGGDAVEYIQPPGTRYRVLIHPDQRNFFDTIIARDPTTNNIYTVALGFGDQGLNPNKANARIFAYNLEESSFSINITRPAGYNENTDTVVLEVWTGANGAGTRLYSVTGITALTTIASFLYKLPPNTTFYVRGKIQRTAAVSDSAWLERSFRTPA